MKKKVVIITIYDPNPNMGNRLQNYAVQKIFENLNYDVVTISFKEKIKMNNIWKLKLLINKLTNYRFAKHRVYWRKIQKRYDELDKFNERYIKTFNVNNLSDIPDADFYVLGSDQLWNPKWWDEANPKMEQSIYLASFAPKDKVLCVSPSFGCDDIPESWKPWFKKYLNRIPEICVREEAGRKIIKVLTGKDSIVTIDPTLMLSAKDWNEIIEQPEGIGKNEKYILAYFLGGTSEQAERDLNAYSKEFNIKVYRIFDERCETLYSINPSNFVYLIKNASLIMTDSFHACVFSFIYDRPFLLYDRVGTPGMMSRMDTLFDKFDLKRKYVNSGLTNEVLEHDYFNGYCNLKEEKNILRNFIIRQTKNIDDI